MSRHVQPDSAAALGRGAAPLPTGSARRIVFALLLLASCHVACSDGRIESSGAPSGDADVQGDDTDANPFDLVFPDTVTDSTSGQADSDVADVGEVVPDTGTAPDVAIDVPSIPDVAPDVQVPDVAEDTGFVPDVPPTDVLDDVPVDVPDTPLPDVQEGLDVTDAVEDAGGDDAADTPDVPEDVYVPPTFGSVEGIVWHANGDPAAAVTVSHIGETVIKTATNAQGFFQLDDIPSGEALLQFGPTPGGEAALVKVIVVADQKTNLGIIALGKTGSIEGFVDPFGSDDKVKSWVSIPGTVAKTSTNALGYFMLVEVPPACLTLLVQRNGFQDLEVEVCVESETIADVGTLTVYPVGMCIPHCEGKVCGDDGCGEPCGQCPGKQLCVAGACVIGGMCPNGMCELNLGETCDSCPADCACESGDVCLELGCCTPSCGLAECGDDGCGGSCGECTEPFGCSGSICVLTGGTCGDGSCEPAAFEDCKTCAVDCACAGGDTCLFESGECCTPACDGKDCGDDGCGGSCGGCAAGFTCDGSQCTFSCSDLEVEPLPDTGPLPSLAPLGAVETVTDEGYTDHVLHSPGGSVRLAVREDWGGTVVYFGAVGSLDPVEDNTIDVTNGTRGIRSALFDASRSWQGCAASASCETDPGAACPSGPTFRGWNPTQGVNECGSLPGVLEQVAEPGLLRTTVAPLFWNPDWALDGCGNGGCFDPQKLALESDVILTQSIRFVAEDTVELQLTVHNPSDTAHSLAAQELPVVFAAYGEGVSPDLTTVTDSEGSPVKLDPVGAELTKVFESGGGWASLQQADLGYGIGLYLESGQTSFEAVVTKGASSRLRGLLPVALGPNATVRVRAYLIVGDVLSIRDRVNALAPTIGPFGELEAPAPDQTVGKTLEVSGWALDNGGIETLELLVDGVKVQNLYQTIDRPDVCARYPGYASCGAVGFAGSATLFGLIPCAHLVEVLAVDSDGNSRIIDRRRVFVAPGDECVEAADCEDGDPCTIDQCDGMLGCVRGPKPEKDLKEESCNGLDDDCDGEFDEAPAKGCIDYHEDKDSDGFGTEGAECLCKPVFPYSAFETGDCDDEVPTSFPGAKESCNGVDDNCDGQADEPGATGCQDRFIDEDGDGYGVGDALCLCPDALGPPYEATIGGDCDDADPKVNPGLVEACNGFDDDCDGAGDPDGICPADTHALYAYLEEAESDANHRYGSFTTPPTGYVSEGFAFIAYDGSGEGRLPLYQAFCVACTDHKIATTIDEGFPDYGSPLLLGYCSAASTAEATRPLTRLYSEALSDHLVTTYAYEKAAALANGYVDQGVLCWVP